MPYSFLTTLAAVIAALKADATLTALVGSRVYSDTPDNPVFPFVSVSLTTSPFDTKTSEGWAHTVQCSIFSREPSPAVSGAIQSAVYNVLHRKESNFTAAGFSGIMFTGTAPVFKDPDGKTWHCPMLFQVVVDN